jgi:hypothetical protein
MPFAGRAYVEMGVTGQAAFKAAFAQMQLSVRQFQAGIQKIGGTAFRGVIGSLTTMRRMMGSLIGQATALGAAFGLSVGIKDAIDNASRLEETLNKFNVVFGDLADSQRKWADSFAADMGRSRTEVMDFMSQAQSLIVPVGINQEQAAQMSTTLTQLSYDLASFHNATDPEAFEALRSALLGESEPMKRFGVIVNETAMKAELLKQGLDPTVATEAQKAMARYNIIISQTGQAQGDVERSSFSFANQLKSLQASWVDLSTAIGTAFLPYATVLLDYLRQLVSGLGLNAMAADNTGKVFSLLGEATQYITKPLDLVIRGFNLLRGSLAFVVGMAASATDVFVGLFRLLANNPLTRGLFGEDFVRQVDTIAAAVQQTAKDAMEKNREVMMDSFQIATQPGDLGETALQQFTSKMNEMKAKFDAQVEAAKQAREEKLAEQDQITVEGGQQAADAIAGAFKTFSKDALAAYAAPVKPAEVQETEAAVREAGDRAVQLASPQALEATAVGTFEKFRENAMNQQIVLQKQQAAFLQQIVRVLKDPQTAIMEFTT